MLSAMRLPAPSLRQAGLPLSAASALSAVNMFGACLALVWNPTPGAAPTKSEFNPQERWNRSVGEGCLSTLILFGELSLCPVLSNYARQRQRHAEQRPRSAASAVRRRPMLSDSRTRWGSGIGHEDERQPHGRRPRLGQGKRGLAGRLHRRRVEGATFARDGITGSHHDLSGRLLHEKGEEHAG